MKRSNISICMMIDTWFPFVGGGQVHVKSIINNLKRHPDTQVTLFHSPHHNILIRTLWNIWVIPQVIIRHRQTKFNLIHAHAFAAGLPGKIISLLLDIPIIYTVHGSHLMDTKKSGLKSWGEKFLLTKVRYTHQVSVTKSFTKYPNVNKNITIIRNGVNIKEFNSVKQKKSKEFTLLYVGRDHPTKGIPVLRAAFAKVLQQHPEIKLKLITSGKVTGKALIKQYKKAHVFILPSLAEGLPLVLLEAWAARLPVIATRTSGVTEIATHNQNAILIKPGSEAQLVEAITSIINMSEKSKRRLGENGFRKVQSQFTWDKITSELLTIYRKVIKDYKYISA